MEAILGCMEITRQAYYQWRRREARRREEEEKVLTMVMMVRRRHPMMGTRKLLVKIGPMMAQEGIRIGRDRLFEVLRGNGLLVSRKRKRGHTTVSGKRKMPNLLEGRKIGRPNEAWVVDITYLDMSTGGFMYLFLLMDLYSRYVTGWNLASSLSAIHALEALKGAVSRVGDVSGVIHHSDHGVQYLSVDYMEYMGSEGLLGSMGEVGNAYDNVYVERLIGTLKGEYGLGGVFRSRGDAEVAVREAIGLYNGDRPHESLGYATPESVYMGEVTVGPVYVKSQKTKMGSKK